MKILQLGKFYPVRGGVEKVMYDLTVGLSSEGIDCDMMCASADGPHMEKRLNDRAALYVCRTYGKVASTMISTEMVKAFREICGRYDIVHIHAPDPMACLALFMSGYKGKVVLHWHSDILKNRLLMLFYSPLQNWLLRRADVIVGTTPVYVEQSPFLQSFRSKIDWIPIGIEPMVPDPSLTARIRSRYEGKKIVLSVGRLIPYKGYRYLVEAASFLDDDYVILIAGTGPLGYRLRKQIAGCGLNGKVELLGFVPDNELPSYFGACDVFCFSSIYKTEAFGIAQIEAMSCGKPVVATDIPESGVPWVNSHGVSGLNARPADARSLAAAIASVVEDRKRYDEYSANAKNRYEQFFTKDQMIKKCVNVYEKLF